MSAVKDSVDLSTVVGVSEHIKNMIMENSELGSRLVSLLLVNSGNADEIISSLNSNKKLQLKTSARSGNRRKSGSVSKPQRGVYGRKASMDYTYKKPSDSLGTAGAAGAAAPAAPASATSSASASSEEEEDRVGDETADKLLLRTLEKRRKNSEASARFRNRKRQKREENLKKLEELNGHIDELNKKIDTLVEENTYWKTKLDDINEQKSKQLLEQIKKKNGICL